MIEDLKKKIHAAEKSDVTITPALDSGTKIADFEIDGTEGSIYSPTQVNADWNATEGPAQFLHNPFKFYKSTLTIPANTQNVSVDIGDIDASLANAHFIAGFNFSNSNPIEVTLNTVHTQVLFIQRASVATEQVLVITIMAAYNVWPTTRDDTEPTKKTTKKK